MVQTTENQSDTQNLDELKAQYKRLKSKGGQLKMDLHDLAEGLPADYENLMDVAGQTYELFKKLDEMNKQIKALESQP